MKANELVKKSIEIEHIHDLLKDAVLRGKNKIAFPFDTYISDEVKNQLMKDGFKCYYGTGFGHNDFIVEW